MSCRLNFVVACNGSSLCHRECLSSSSWYASRLLMSALLRRPALLLQSGFGGTPPARHKSTVHLPVGRCLPHANLFCWKCWWGSVTSPTWLTGMLTFYRKSAESRSEIRERNKETKGETSFLRGWDNALCFCLNLNLRKRILSGALIPYLFPSPGAAPLLQSAPNSTLWQVSWSFSCGTRTLYYPVQSHLYLRVY